MTKAELIQALGRYADTQTVTVMMYSEAYPQGAQLFIQGVTEHLPWHPQPGLSNIVAIEVDAENRGLGERQIHKPVPPCVVCHRVRHSVRPCLIRIKDGSPGREWSKHAVHVCAFCLNLHADDYKIQGA